MYILVTTGYRPDRFNFSSKLDTTLNCEIVSEVSNCMKFDISRDLESDSPINQPFLFSPFMP